MKSNPKIKRRWKSTPKGIKHENSYLGLTVEIRGALPRGYVIAVNGYKIGEIFHTISSAKKLINDLGLVGLAGVVTSLRHNFPDFGVEIKKMNRGAAVNVLLPECFVVELQWMSNIVFQATCVIQMEETIYKGDLYFDGHDEAGVPGAFRQLCQEPSSEVVDLWFARKIEFFYLSRPLKIFGVLAKSSEPEGRPVSPEYEPLEVQSFSLEPIDDIFPT